MKTTPFKTSSSGKKVPAVMAQLDLPNQGIVRVSRFKGQEPAKTSTRPMFIIRYFGPPDATGVRTELVVPLSAEGAAATTLCLLQLGALDTKGAKRLKKQQEQRIHANT